jgi:radical SAM protein with 4Fe4S-binding SPASM domain
VAVAPSGNLYSCERLVSEDEDTRHVIGHVTTGVSREHQRAVRGAMPGWHATNDECGSCAERDRCGAYCACANLAETGNLGIAGGVQCWFERTTMRLADQLAERMIEEKNEAFLEWFYPGRREASENYPVGRAAHQIPRPPGPSKDALRHLRVLP